MSEFSTVFEITAGGNGLRREVLFDVAIGVFAVASGVMAIVRARIATRRTCGRFGSL